jgi:hypothetical protein
MSEVTTAQALIAYRDELIAGGVPDHVVDQLVITAGRRVLEDGLAFKEKADA